MDWVAERKERDRAYGNIGRRSSGVEPEGGVEQVVDLALVGKELVDGVFVHVE